MVSKNKEKLPLSIADEQKLKEPKPSLLEQSLVLSWMFLFPVLLIYLLYRFRKSYTKHTSMYIISFIMVTLYILFHILVMIGMYGGGAFS